MVASEIEQWLESHKSRCSSMVRNLLKKKMPPRWRGYSQLRKKLLAGTQEEANKPFVSLAVDNILGGVTLAWCSLLGFLGLDNNVSGSQWRSKAHSIGIPKAMCFGLFMFQSWFTNLPKHVTPAKLIYLLSSKSWLELLCLPCYFSLICSPIALY